MDGPSVAWICTRTHSGNISKLCGLLTLAFFLAENVSLSSIDIIFYIPKQ